MTGISATLFRHIDQTALLLPRHHSTPRSSTAGVLIKLQASGGHLQDTPTSRGTAQQSHACCERYYQLAVPCLL